jgi:hypothetical protein
MLPLLIQLDCHCISSKLCLLFFEQGVPKDWIRVTNRGNLLIINAEKQDENREELSMNNTFHAHSTRRLSSTIVRIDDDDNTLCCWLVHVPVWLRGYDFVRDGNDNGISDAVGDLL